MRILGIESSSLVASVAIVTDGVLTGEYTMNYKKTDSQTLLPMLDELTRMLDLDLETVDGVAVSEAQVLLPACGLVQPRQRGWDWPLKSL